MEKLIKTIPGSECTVYAIKNHSRVKICEAVPTVEVYEEFTEVPILNEGLRKKGYLFSVIFCDDVKNENVDIEDISSFELQMYLRRYDGVYAPFELCDITDVSLEPHRWVFTVDDIKTTERLLDFVQCEG